ncbi:MAG: GntR family transcriptional regulator [Aestuariivita sp.]|nr:GntR family transcriptional regulator [Aestuariivita sp.]
MTFADRQSWKDVREEIRSRILDSTYRPGDKLPRDHDLALELKCARSTVQRAMSSLADAGIIERKRKGGTIIKLDPVTRATINIPITKVEIEARGLKYRHHLITSAVTKAPLSISARFGIADLNSAVRVKALHMAAGRPYVLEDRWISLETVPEFRGVDLSNISANEWLVRNRPYSRCNVQIYAELIMKKEANLMEVPEGSAMLILERTTWIGDEPITHVKATHTVDYRLITNG